MGFDSSLLRPRGHIIGCSWFCCTSFIINRLLFLFKCEGYHIIVKQLCSFKEDKIKKAWEIGCMKLMLIRFYYHLVRLVRAISFNITGSRGGSRMRGAPGTLVFATHLHPHPEVRVCATNIFTGSDIIAAIISRFVNSCCHQSHPVSVQKFDIITPCVWKFRATFTKTVYSRVGYKDLLVCFFSAFTV